VAVVEEKCFQPCGTYGVEAQSREQLSGETVTLMVKISIEAFLGK
jgi:hypothetical protein